MLVHPHDQGYEPRERWACERGRGEAGSGEHPQQLGEAPEQLNSSSVPPDMATEAGD